MLFVIGMHSIANYDICGININKLYKYTLCSSGIPLFFTVSGYLLLGRKNIDWHYSAKKIWGIIRFVFIVCWIYWLIMLVITQEPHWDKLYKDPLGAFLKGGTFWHFWYFGAMILIYLIYPLINKIYIDKPQYFKHLLLLLIIICLIIYIINIITPGPFEKRVPQPFRVWNWLLYFCIGGYINKNKKNIKWRFVLTSFLLYFLQIIIIKKINPSMFIADYHYCSIFTLINVYCLFQALNSIDTRSISNSIKLLSPLFLPVYTIHIGFIYAYPIIKLWFAPMAIIYWMLISIMSIAVSWLIMQTKVGKLIFKI